MPITPYQARKHQDLPLRLLTSSGLCHRNSMHLLELTVTVTETQTNTWTQQSLPPHLVRHPLDYLREVRREGGGRERGRCTQIGRRVKHVTGRKGGVEMNGGIGERRVVG